MKLFKLPDTTVIDLSQVESVTRLYQLDEDSVELFEIVMRSRQTFALEETMLSREVFLQVWAQSQLN